MSEPIAMFDPACPVCHGQGQHVTQRGNITETKACTWGKAIPVVPAEPVVPPADETVDSSKPLVITQP